MLSLEDRQRIDTLKSGRIKPADGFEKHFLMVIGGKGRAATPREKEWIAYAESKEIIPTSQPSYTAKIDREWGSGGAKHIGKEKSGIGLSETSTNDSEAAKISEGVGQRSIPGDEETVAENWLKSARRKISGHLTNIENRTDLTDDQKATHIINLFSATCAGIAAQPIPFADFFVLTPLQIWMAERIAAIRGVPVTEASAMAILKEIAATIGLGLLGQQLILGAYKTFIPFLGALTTIPLVYGATYGIGRVLDYYFKQKARNQRIDPKKMKDIWKEARKEGKKEGKKRKRKLDSGNEL